MRATFSKTLTIAAIAAVTLVSGAAQADRGYLSLSFGEPGVSGVRYDNGGQAYRSGYDRDYGRDYGRGHERHQQRDFDRANSVFDVRQDNQMDRIRQGVRSGELTPWEVRELAREQREIAALEQRFLADGRLDRYEFRRLDRELDEAARNIRAEQRDAEDRDDFRQYRGNWR